MKEIINEWREFLSEQDPAKAPTPGDKLLKKVEDLPNFKDTEKKLTKRMRDDLKKIPPGFMHPGQPTPNRTTLEQGVSTEIVDYGPAKLDKVLAWSMDKLKNHAASLGIISDYSKYFMPVGSNSGLRSNKVQKEKFVNKFNQINNDLKKGVPEITKGPYTITQKNGNFFFNEKRIRNLANAIHILARQEIARPYEELKLTAFDNSSVVTEKGNPKHLTGRTIDFFLQGDEGQLEMDLNNKARKSKTGKFLKYYGPMYGIVNYGGESWHWEMDAPNRAFFEKMMKQNITPIQSAFNALATKDLKPKAE
tara:strand:+ start:6857 stop:7777 length:921 start_codon:yes stop_codon:yes gene_type:complete